MAEKVLMPQLSDTMETGIIVNWKVEEGDEIEVGDVIAEVETDKATMDLEAFESGVLLKKVAEEGQEVPTQELIAVIGEEGEDVSGLLGAESESGPQSDSSQEDDDEADDKDKEDLEDDDDEDDKEDKEDKKTDEDDETDGKNKEAAADSEPEEADSQAEESETESDEEKKPAPEPVDTSKLQATGVETDERIRISPVARRMVEENDIDISRVQGSGSESRITKSDIERAIESGKNLSPKSQPLSSKLKSEKVELSGMRRTIAQRMSKSKREIPHFHLQSEIDMEQIDVLRRDFEEFDREVSYNSFILLAAARTLAQRPELNASYEEDYLQRYGYVNLAFAVSVEDGLLTPVIENAEQLDLFQLQEESNRLVEKARAGQLKPDEYNSGTFTVSNLGMFGIRNFSAVINPPQAAILAVGAVEKRPVEKDGDIVISTVMDVTLSCDHRVVDGAAGARYLQEFKKILEHPAILISS